MDGPTRNLVRRRAQYRCEYCLLPERSLELPHHIEHILARQHGGVDEVNNLALACHHCNRHKGPNLAGIDPVTGEISRLFHPRSDAWDEHFVRQGVFIEGVTPRGRATVRVLAMNDPQSLELRSALLARGLLT